MGLDILKNRAHLIAPMMLLVFYSALPNRYAMHDAIYFAQAAEAGNLQSPLLWHPSHLLYEPGVYCLYQALHAFELKPSIFQLCTTLGILSSFFVMYMAGRLLVLNQVPPRWAALAMLMWAGSYVAWHCATESDLSRNPLAILILLGAFYVIALGEKGTSKAWPFFAGFLIGLAGLSHILTVFAVPALCFFLWKSTEKSGRAWAFMTVLIVSAVTVISGYSLAIMFLAHVRGIQSFMDWFAAPGGAEWWQFDLLRGMLDFTLTAIRALLGTVTYAPLKRAFFSGATENAGTLIFALLAVTILSYWGLLVLSGATRRLKSLSVIGQTMLIWFVSYLPFTLLFDPRDIRVFLYLSIPFAMLAADCASRGPARRHLIAGLITALLLFGANGSTIMLKESKPETQRAYILLQRMNALSQNQSDLFLVSMGTDARYAQYFGKRRAISVRVTDTNFSTLRLDLFDVKKTGKRLFIETDLLNMIVGGEHPYSAVLMEMIGLNIHSRGGSEDHGFKLIRPTSSR